MSAFYLARPASLKVHALSAAVGSGKTRAATAYMARPATARQNFLYVAPTIALIKQMDANLRRALGAAESSEVRNINLIHAENTEGSAREEALRSINEAGSCEGRVVLLATTTFLHVISMISEPRKWHVILDEAFSPVEFVEFSLGKDVCDGWNYFRELFDVDPDQASRIVPREGRKGLVADVAAGKFNRAGEKYTGLRRVAEPVSNPAVRCELVMGPRVAALMEGRELPARRLKRGGREDDTDNVLQFASYVDPAFFAGFADVLFLSALFEQTILYALWTRALGVTFQDHPEFPRELLRDTHGDQGRFLAVGHLLHKDDTASKENLFRNVLTGEAREQAEGQRVIDQVIGAAAVYFKGSRFLLQVNKRTGYHPGSPLLPSNAVLIPAYAHGLNDYQDVHNVAALCVTNPTPQQRAWVMSRTGMTSREVGLSWRIHTAYQAMGRCSIRNAALADHPKVVLTVGVDDAQFIRSQFPGSHWLSQVGDLPSLRGLAQQSAPPKIGKTEAIAGAIRDHLNRLGPEVIKVASRTLKGTLGIDCPSRTWATAVTVACTTGSGWRREGACLHRVTASDYGFSPV